MSSGLPRNIQYSKIRKHLAQSPDIWDIILFGSSLRGKRKASDLDVLVVFGNELDLEKTQQLKGLFPEHAEVLPITVADMTSDAFRPREDILADGFSLRLGGRISHAFGYSSQVLFLCDFNFSQNERMRFHHALHGRKSEGILRRVKGRRVAPKLFAIPAESSDGFREFLDSWKISYKRIRAVVPDIDVGKLGG